jgi:acyl carrier protein
VTDARATVLDAIGQIAPEADLGALADDAAIQEAVDLDSLDFLDLVTAVSEATGVDVPERDYPDIATLGDFVRYLETRITT